MKRQLLCSLLLLAGCTRAGAESSSTSGTPKVAPREGGVRVEVAALAPSRAQLELKLPGEIEGARDALLAAALGGYVEAVLVAEGHMVKKGQSLVRVDTSLYVARREQVQAEFDQATNELNRVKSMGEAVSRAAKEQAETRWKIAQAALRQVEVQVSRSVITAPFDGTVAQLNTEVGEIAAPGAPIARVVQLDPVRVSVSVSDRDVVALKTGSPVSVTTEASTEVFEGTLSFVSPVSDLRTRSFIAKVDVPNPNGKLLPGMIARVRVATESGEQGLVLPQHVMVTRMTDVGVFIDEGGVARWRPLKLGSVVGSQVVVASGVSAGDRVVVTGHRELVEGDKLSTAREGTCCEAGRVVFAQKEGAK